MRHLLQQHMNPVLFLMENITFNSCSQLLKFVDYMNSKHPNIKLTVEVEKAIISHF